MYWISSATRYLFVDYPFTQQLIAGRLYKHFLARTTKLNVQEFEKAYLLVHIDIPGGHWTFISITFGKQTRVLYHDSIEAMRYKFDDCRTPLNQFLTGIGCKDISYNYAQTAQQEDGCSCGIFVLAGIIMHINNRQLQPLHRHDVSCFRRELFQSVLLHRLNIDQTPEKKSKLQRKDSDS